MKTLPPNEEELKRHQFDFKKIVKRMKSHILGENIFKRHI